MHCGSTFAAAACTLVFSSPRQTNFIGVFDSFSHVAYSESGSIWTLRDVIVLLVVAAACGAAITRIRVLFPSHAFSTNVSELFCGALLLVIESAPRLDEEQEEEEDNDIVVSRVYRLL